MVSIGKSRRACQEDGRRLDAALALLLLAVTVLYLAALPLSLGGTDEGHTLHEAKRLLDGEVMYRDVFDLSTPGWVYLMAALFRLFGTTLATARIAAAVIHGGIAVLLYLICRVLGVRRALAWACALAYLAVCPRMFPIASYHWLATFLSVALLLLCLRSTADLTWALVLGVVVGLLVAVHQQRGVSMGLAVAAFFAADALIEWRHRDSSSWTALRYRFGAFAGGLALVVGSMLIVIVTRAGIEPVWRALVIQPLVNYRGIVSCPWGFVWGGASASPDAVMLKYLPVVTVLAVPAWLVLLWQGRSPERARALAVLVVFGACSILSIAYYPDVIHLALIAPVFFVALADAFERALRLLPAPLALVLGAVTAVAVVIAGSLRLYENLTRLRAQYPVAYQSAFGRIDLQSVRQRSYWTQLQTLIDAEPSRMLYCYPQAAYAHLLSGARNPVRFEFVIPWSYTSPEQVQEVVDGLASTRVRYVLGGRQLGQADDPIAGFIREHFERAPVPSPLRDTLWRRKDDG